MNNFLNSKLFLTLEHAVKVSIFIALSAFVTELVNTDFATLLTHYLPSFITVATVNVFLGALIKYVNLKKTEILLAEYVKPALPQEVINVVESDDQTGVNASDPSITT